MKLTCFSYSRYGFKIKTSVMLEHVLNNTKLIYLVKKICFKGSKQTNTINPHKKYLPPLNFFFFFVRTYMIHLLGTYVNILCNWLIL